MAVELSKDKWTFSKSSKSKSKPKPKTPSPSSKPKMVPSPVTGMLIREEDAIALEEKLEKQKTNPSPSPSKSEPEPVFTGEQPTSKAPESFVEKIKDSPKEPETEKNTMPPPTVHAADNIKTRTTAGRIINDLTTSFLTGFGLKDDALTTQRIQSGGGTIAEEAGLLAGSVAQFVAPGKIAQGVSKATTITKSTLQASRFGQAISNLPSFPRQVVTFTGDLIEIGARGSVISQTGLQVGKSRAGFKELGLDKETTQTALKEASQAEREYVEGLPGIRETIKTTFKEGIPSGLSSAKQTGQKMGFELLGSVASGRTGRDAFKEQIEQSLLSQGIDPVTAAAASEQSSNFLKGRNVGEIVALADISRAVEGTGRLALKETFTNPFKTGSGGLKQFLQTASTTAGRIGQAGFIEGATQELTQQQTRFQPFDAGAIVEMGSLGAVSAGTIGGLIAGSRVAKETAIDVASKSFFRGLGRTTETVANVLDPLEKVGDVSQDLFEEGAKRSLRNKIADIPVFSSSISPSGVKEINPDLGSRFEGFNNQINSFGGVSATPNDGSVTISSGSPSQSQTSGSSKTSNILNENQWTFADTSTTTSSRSKTKRAFQPVVTIPTEPNVPIPTEPNIPVPVQPVVPIPTPVPIPTAINIPTQPNVPVQPTINIPTTTFDDSLFPPIILPQVPSGGTGWSWSTPRSRTKKKKPSKSVFQSLFNLPTGFKQEGVSEMTGIFLRR
jgi:hypothetical protein